MMKMITKFNYGKMLKLTEKMMIPLAILGITAIGSVFYKQGKLDAIEEINSGTETKD